MEILRINLDDSSSWLSAHARMRETIESKGTVIFSTDTIYGLGCNALDETAVRKTFLIKGRDAEKSLPLFVRELAQARSVASINKSQECFLKKVWPGKVTAVLKKRSELSGIVTGEKETAGIRIPNFPFINVFMEAISFPIIGTSANISGKQPFGDGASAFSYFKEQKFQPDLIIDAGRLPDSKPSTVVDLTVLTIVREGAVAREDIFRWWGDCLAEKTI